MQDSSSESSDISEEEKKDTVNSIISINNDINPYNIIRKGKGTLAEERQMLKEIHGKCFKKGMEELEKAVRIVCYEDVSLALQDLARINLNKNRINSILKKLTIKLNKKNYIIKFKYFGKFKSILQGKKYNDLNTTMWNMSQDLKKKTANRIYRYLYYHIYSSKERGFNQWKNQVKKIKETCLDNIKQSIKMLKMENAKLNCVNMVNLFQALADKNRKIRITKSFVNKYRQFLKLKKYKAMTNWKKQVDIINKNELIQKIRNISAGSKYRNYRRVILFKKFNFWKFQSLYISTRYEKRNNNLLLALYKLRKRQITPIVIKMRYKIFSKITKERVEQKLINTFKKKDQGKLCYYFNIYKSKVNKLLIKDISAGIVKKICNFLDRKAIQNERYRLNESFTRWRDVINTTINGILAKNVKDLLVKKIVKNKLLTNKETIDKHFYLWRRKVYNKIIEERNNSIKNKIFTKNISKKIECIYKNYSNYLNKWLIKAKILKKREQSLTKIDNIYRDNIENIRKNIFDLLHEIAEEKFLQKQLNKKLILKSVNFKARYLNDKKKKCFNLWNKNANTLKTNEEKNNIINHIQKSILKNRINNSSKEKNNIKKTAFNKWRIITNSIIKNERLEKEKFNLHFRLLFLSLLKEYDKNNLSYNFKLWKNKVDKEIDNECLNNEIIKRFRKVYYLNEKKYKDNDRMKLYKALVKWNKQLFVENVNILIENVESKILKRRVENNDKYISEIKSNKYRNWYRNSNIINILQGNENILNYQREKILKNRILRNEKYKKYIIKRTFNKWRDNKDRIIRIEQLIKFKDFEMNNLKIKYILINKLKRYERKSLSYNFNKWRDFIYKQKLIDFQNKEIAKRIKKLYYLSEQKAEMDSKQKLTQAFFKWYNYLLINNTSDIITHLRSKNIKNRIALVYARYNNRLKDKFNTWRNKTLILGEKNKFIMQLKQKFIKDVINEKDKGKFNLKKTYFNRWKLIKEELIKNEQALKFQKELEKKGNLSILLHKAFKNLGVFNLSYGFKKWYKIVQEEIEKENIEYIYKLKVLLILFKKKDEIQTKNKNMRLIEAFILWKNKDNEKILDLINLCKNNFLKNRINKGQEQRKNLLRQRFKSWLKLNELSKLDNRMLLENITRNKTLKSRMLACVINKMNNNIKKISLYNWRLKNKFETYIDEEKKNIYKGMRTVLLRLLPNILKRKYKNHINFYFKKWEKKVEEEIEKNNLEMLNKLKLLLYLIKAKDTKESKSIHQNFIKVFMEWKLLSQVDKDLFLKYRNELLRTQVIKKDFYLNNKIKNKFSFWKNKNKKNIKKEIKLHSLCNIQKEKSKFKLKNSFIKWKIISLYDNTDKLDQTIKALRKIRLYGNKKFINSLRFFVQFKEINNTKKKNEKILQKFFCDVLKRQRLKKRSKILTKFIEKVSLENINKKRYALTKLNKKAGNIKVILKAKAINKFLIEIKNKNKNKFLNLFTEKLFNIITRRIYTNDTKIINDAFTIKKILNLISKIIAKHFINKLSAYAKISKNIELINSNLLKMYTKLIKINKKTFIRKIFKLYTYKILDQLFSYINNKLYLNKKIMFLSLFLIRKSKHSPVKYINYLYTNKVSLDSKRQINKNLIKFNFKSRVKNQKHLPMKPENKNIIRIILPNLIYFIQDKITLRKKWSLYKLQSGAKTKKLTDKLKSFISKKIISPKNKFFKKLKNISQKDYDYISKIQGLKRLINKYYIYNLKKIFQKSKQIVNLFYLLNLVYMHKNISKYKYIRKIIRRWRFTGFVNIMARKKLEMFYKTLNSSFIEEYETFGKKLQMFDNDTNEDKNYYNLARKKIKTYANNDNSYLSNSNYLENEYSFSKDDADKEIVDSKSRTYKSLNKKKKISKIIEKEELSD